MDQPAANEIDTPLDEANVQVTPDVVDLIASYSKCQTCSRVQPVVDQRLGVSTKLGLGLALLAISISTIYSSWLAVHTRQETWKQFVRPVLLGQNIRGMSPIDFFGTREKQEYLSSVLPRPIQFVKPTDSKDAFEYLALGRAYSLLGEEKKAALNYGLVAKCSAPEEIKLLASIEEDTLDGVTEQSRKRLSEFLTSLYQRQTSLTATSSVAEVSRLYEFDELAQQTAQHLVIRGEKLSELPCLVAIATRPGCMPTGDAPGPLPPGEDAHPPAAAPAPLPAVLKPSKISTAKVVQSPTPLAEPR